MVNLVFISTFYDIGKMTKKSPKNLFSLHLSLSLNIIIEFFSGNLKILHDLQCMKKHYCGMRKAHFSD